MSNDTQHTVNLINRESLSVSGVTDVDEFNEQEIIAVCGSDELRIKGELLHIEELSSDTGQLVVSGRVISLMYSEKLSSGSIIKRLFGG